MPGKPRSRTTAKRGSARPAEFVDTLVCGKLYRARNMMDRCRLEEGHKGDCGPVIMSSTRIEDPLARAVQGVIERRSKILAEEIIQELLDAMRQLSPEKLKVVLNGTERAGMRGYGSSSRHKRKKK